MDRVSTISRRFSHADVFIFATFTCAHKSATLTYVCVISAKKVRSNHCRKAASPFPPIGDEQHGAPSVEERAVHVLGQVGRAVVPHERRAASDPEQLAPPLAAAAGRKSGEGVQVRDTNALLTSRTGPRS
eukprot:gene51-biopygen6048